MTALLKGAWGYQGDAMNLPVANVGTSADYYVKIMGFRIESTDQSHQKAATLERDGIRMRLVENGGDPSQDGCAFQVEGVESLFEEFKRNGWEAPDKPEGNFEIETHEDGKWKVFFVVAPDGLCFWFGEKMAEVIA